MTGVASSTLGSLVSTMEGSRDTVFPDRKAVGCYICCPVGHRGCTRKSPLDRTAYPITAWVQDSMAKPCSGTAQTPTLAKWVAYLQQRSTLSTNPLQTEL